MSDESEATDIAVLKEKVRALEEARKDDRKIIENLVAFQRWVLGGASVIGVMIGFFMDWIKTRVGLR